MKVTVPEISFHNRDPILSVDLQHNSPDGINRMATGGTDTHVVIWQVCPLPSGGVSVEALSDLVRHNRAVNAVRFSPDGLLLASADDEAAIIIWKRLDLAGNAPDLFGDDGENKESWTIHKMLRGHIEDVYDLSWSACSTYLVSGSIDNSAIMWDVNKGKNVGLLKEHKNFVQGVAWDPQGQYVATLSSDRILRWFSVSSKRVMHRVQKAMLPTVAQDGTVKEVSTRLFYDDTLKSFCRRLSFSPDGLLLVAPSGILEGEESGGRHCNAVHVFTRLSPTRPVVYLPTKDKYTLAVRFCPLLYRLRKGRPNTAHHGQSVFALPYRMVFAVACQNSVVLYDTQQLVPFARISNMHYTRLTDLAWSADGRILAISSTDGYCSLTYFNDGELGEVYSPNENTPEKARTTENTTEKARTTENTTEKARATENTTEKASATENTTEKASANKANIGNAQTEAIKKVTPGKNVTPQAITRINTSEKRSRKVTPKKKPLRVTTPKPDRKSKNLSTDGASEACDVSAKKEASQDKRDVVDVKEKKPNSCINNEIDIKCVDQPMDTSDCSKASKENTNAIVTKDKDIASPAKTTKPPAKTNILIARRAPKVAKTDVANNSSPATKSVAAKTPQKLVSPALAKLAGASTGDASDDSESLGSTDDAILSDDSESIGSDDSDEEEDDGDDDVSMVSFDDNDELCLDEDMGVTKIVHDDEPMDVDDVGETSKFSKNTKANLDRRRQRGKAEAKSKLYQKAVVDTPAGNTGKQSTDPEGSRSSKVNLIAVKRQPESNRPPRRVALTSVARAGAVVAKADPVAETGQSPPVAASVVDCVMENTSDLCLRLEGEDTVTSPVKKLCSSPPTECGSSPHKEVESTPDKKPETPAKKADGSSRKKDTTPAKKDTTPAKKDTTLAKKDTTPEKKDTTPAKKDTTPAKNASPPKNDTTPFKKADEAVGASTKQASAAMHALSPYTPTSASKPPRRVSLITLASPKAKKTLHGKAAADKP